MDKGIKREFIAEARRKVASAAPPRQVEIKLSVNHPYAKEFLELFELLADHQILQSGLEVRRTPIPGAEEKLLALLAKMGVDTARVLADVKAGDKKGKHEAAMRAGFDLLRTASDLIPIPKGDSQAIFGLLGGLLAQKKEGPHGEHDRSH